MPIFFGARAATMKPEPGFVRFWAMSPSPLAAARSSLSRKNGAPCVDGLTLSMLREVAGRVRLPRAAQRDIGRTGPAPVRHDDRHDGALDAMAALIAGDRARLAGPLIVGGTGAPLAVIHRGPGAPT